MSHIKEYIEKSLLIAPDAKESLLQEEVHEVIKADMACFMEMYIPMEQEIMNHINEELEILNMQIKRHIENNEMKLKEQEIMSMEQEIAYL